MDASGALTVKDVAAFLRMTPQAVYNMIRREEIPAFKVGSAVRVLRSDLDAYVALRKRVFAAEIATYQAPDGEVLAARKLCAHFGGSGPSFSLDPVSFELPRGGTLGVIGPSGSGKTLLLKALAGLIPIDAGALFFGSRRLDGLDAHSRRSAFVFQDYALYPLFDGGRNIAFPLTIAKEPAAVVDPEVERIAAELGIDRSYLVKRIEELPEGIKQLVAIGRAENRPRKRPMELLLMDEPLIHLDAGRRAEMRAFLKRLVASFGATTIYALNDAADALALAEYLLVLREGGAVQFGPSLEVFHRPADAEIMELLSLHGVSVLHGSYDGGRVLVDSFGGSLSASLPDGVDPGYQGRVSLVFRPEEVEAAEGGEGLLGALIERSLPYDGGRSLASGALVAPGAAAPAEGAPRIRFMVPNGAEGVFRFRPTAAMAFPLG